MKFNIQYKDGGDICVTKMYDPGEKYITALAWKEKDGILNKEIVEKMFPECEFVGVAIDSGIRYDVDTIAFKKTTFVRVLLQKTYGVEI